MLTGALPAIAASGHRRRPSSRPSASRGDGVVALLHQRLGERPDPEEQHQQRDDQRGHVARDHRHPAGIRTRACASSASGGGGELAADHRHLIVAARVDSRPRRGPAAVICWISTGLRGLPVSGSRSSTATDRRLIAPGRAAGDRDFLAEIIGAGEAGRSASSRHRRRRRRRAGGARRCAGVAPAAASAARLRRGQRAGGRRRVGQRAGNAAGRAGCRACCVPVQLPCSARSAPSLS